MTDLTERLRTTRLLSQRNQLALQEEAAATLETLTQENARLREALEEIARLNVIKEWTATDDDPVTHWEVRDGFYAIIARKALGGGDE